MNLTERISYIRGLCDGLKLDENKDEVKVLSAIIDLLEDMAYDVTDMEDIVDDVCNQVDEIDEDLAELEEEVYGEYDDCCDDDCCCDDDDVYYEVTCGKCGEEITVDEDVLLEGEIICPNCGEKLEFDFSELKDEDWGCDCGCDHDHDDHADEDLMS
ncbi:MAG: hypothetical protein IJR57_08895 [Ruminococcus sp.]|nr:hypothetical protein [Ruminococcus sp.]